MATNEIEARNRYFVDPFSHLTTLHKQPRGFLKTVARMVGKDTTQESLFIVPYFDQSPEPYKEVFSRKTAITGNYLLKLWQNGINKIKNLSKVAKELGVEPSELKLYLICLGGYQMPVTQLRTIEEGGKKKRILSTYSDKIFYIKFNHILKDDEQEDDFNEDFRVGTRYVSFIRDREIESIEFVPSATLQSELKGKGLGNILVDDGFIAFALGLSDLAYKLLSFTGSNVPTYKMSFDKLIKKEHLNLERLVYGVYNKAGKRIKNGQGKPRVLQRIKDAFEELKTKGHIKDWDYNEQTDYFIWTCTDKVIKHKEHLKEKNQ